MAQAARSLGPSTPPLAPSPARTKTGWWPRLRAAWDPPPRRSFLAIKNERPRTANCPLARCNQEVYTRPDVPATLIPDVPKPPRRRPLMLSPRRILASLLLAALTPIPSALRLIPFVVSLSGRVRPKPPPYPHKACPGLSRGPESRHAERPQAHLPHPVAHPAQPQPSYPRTRASTGATLAPRTRLPRPAAASQSSPATSPHPLPEHTAPRPTRHSGVSSRNPGFVPQRASDPPKSAPPQPKSFLERGLYT